MTEFRTSVQIMQKRGMSVTDAIIAAMDKHIEQSYHDRNRHWGEITAIKSNVARLDQARHQE